MTRQNRVTPFGEIVADSSRGMFFGNRGCLHDGQGRIVRRHQGQRWITCVLDFNGRRRELMVPGRYTELFFLDEATALAAGHRPCAECRRDAYNRFRSAWAEGAGVAVQPSAAVLDASLHADRLADDGSQATYQGGLSMVPSGAMVAIDSRAFLVTVGGLLAWTPSGYERPAGPQPHGALSVTVLTPRSTVLALQAGYEPELHPSAAPLPAPPAAPPPPTVPPRPAGTRLDVSAVPAQGAYVAKRCPRRAHLDNDPTNTAKPLGQSAAAQMRAVAGNDFEAKIFAELAALHSDAVVVDRGTSRVERERATLAAMTRGAPLVIGGRLLDEPAHRVGEPDVLVRVGVHESAVYIAVDVKHHLTAKAATRRSTPLTTSSLADPTPAAAVTDELLRARRRDDDLYQLAHYQRMLEASGFASPEIGGGGHLAGIIGTERVVTWHDLDAPIMTDPYRRRRSPMQRYDAEFAFRLDVIARALQQADTSADEPLVTPIWIPECTECRWRDACRPLLDAADDISLVPKVNYRQRMIHQSLGTETRADLAALDWQVATLIDAKIDVAGLQARASGMSAQTPIDDNRFSLNKKAVATLHIVGIVTARDLLTLDDETVRYSGQGVSGLVTQIDKARAGLAGGAFRVRELGWDNDPVEVRRADIEVDIDMENVASGVYLWGALVTDRSGRLDVREGYHAFVSFEPLRAAVDADIFRRFWAWITSLQSQAVDAGLSMAKYCYHASAENTQLRRTVRANQGQTGIPTPTELHAFERELVDLEVVVKRDLVTPGGTGLKEIATFAEFAWRDADPDGDQSQAWYVEATTAGDEATRQQARQRLLAYNEDDVKATRAVREWLSRDQGRALPTISEAR